jgi:Zn-finger nucleic acid-binding protein
MDEARRLDCPECGAEPLGGSWQERAFLYECGRCAGQFVEHPALLELFESRAALADIVPKRAARSNPLGQKVRYLPCAVCSELMNRKNFGGESGIIVDVCAQHGIWFQRGELGAVLSFVAQGGLVRARRRQEERARHGASLRRAYGEGLLPPAGPSPTSPGDSTDPGSLTDLGEGVIELIEFLHDVLASR